MDFDFTEDQPAIERTAGALLAKRSGWAQEHEHAELGRQDDALLPAGDGADVVIVLESEVRRPLPVPRWSLGCSSVRRYPHSISAAATRTAHGAAVIASARHAGT